MNVSSGMFEKKNELTFEFSRNQHKTATFSKALDLAEQTDNTFYNQTQEMKLSNLKNHVSIQEPINSLLNTKTHS